MSGEERCSSTLLRGESERVCVALHHAPEVRKTMVTPARAEEPPMRLHVSPALLTLL
jgi:hypothetical protein